ncbi:hypothetical protein niasHT_025167 [Heterodera trifolii]|uniref:Ubiquitin-like domain-containing protein n=1 Tax=Heterodera trifolii TaxID=157864 RepID=A0ABD2JLG7_9BILA
MLMLLIICSTVADNEFKIYLRVRVGPYGWTSGPTVMMKGEDTVADLKRKIAEKHGIEPKRQMLRHKSEFDPPLEDSKTVKDYDIEKDSVLFLTVDEFGIRILAEIKDNGVTSKYTVMVKAEDTVANLKRKIAKKVQIETERQMLRHKSEFGPPLEDSKTVKDYDIEKYPTLFLTLDDYVIYVHFNEKNCPIWVRKSDPVRILEKKAIQMLNNEFKIDLDDIKLKRCDSAGTYNMFLQTHYTMEKYGINEGTIIYVNDENDVLFLIAFEIFVELSQKRYSVWVKHTDTVRDLKAKIGNIQEIGILPNQQKLIICQKTDGAVLDDEKTIFDYKIQKNSTVFLTLAEIEQQEVKPSSSSSKQQREKKHSSNKTKKTLRTDRHS